MLRLTTRHTNTLLSMGIPPCCQLIKCKISTSDVTNNGMPFLLISPLIDYINRTRMETEAFDFFFIPKRKRLMMAHSVAGKAPLLVYARDHPCLMESVSKETTLFISGHHVPTSIGFLLPTCRQLRRRRSSTSFLANTDESAHFCIRI